MPRIGQKAWREARYEGYLLENVSNTVKTATAPPPSGADVYRIESNPRGYFLIINNIKFNDLSSRFGAIKDSRLKNLFNQMGYLGDYITNLTGKDMEKHLREFCSNEKLRSVDSTIVAIMTHGFVFERDLKIYFAGTDCRKDANEGAVALNTVIEMFSSEECKLRKGKPKIFCFQNCSGNGEMHGYGEMYNNRPLSERDSVSDSPISAKDTFVLLSNVDGYVSNCIEQYGTWFILAITAVFQEFAYKTDLETMMGLINHRLQSLFYESQKNNSEQVPYQVAVLKKIGISKKLYFNLFGIVPEPEENIQAAD